MTQHQASVFADLFDFKPFTKQLQEEVEAKQARVETSFDYLDDPSFSPRDYRNDRMVDFDEPFGYVDTAHAHTDVYIIGNTGVGKSFLANCLLQRWVFASLNQAASCTRIPSFEPMKYMDHWWHITNIPGLLEADIDRVKQNVEILQQVLNNPHQSVVFVDLLAFIHKDAH